MGVIDLNSQELIAGMASGIKSHKIDEENKMVTFNFNNGTSVAMQVNTSKAKIERVLAAFMENDTTLVKAIEFNSKAESYLKDDIASEKGIVASREYVKNYDISDKLNAYLGENLYVNAKDYGAVGDGETDDTEAIKNAILGAIEKGIKLYVPEGIYRINEKVSIQGKTYLEMYGDGQDRTIFKAVDGLAKGQSMFVFRGCTHVKFHDFSIDGNSEINTDGNATDGIHMWDIWASEDVDIYNLTWQNNVYVGTRIANCKNVRVHNCKCSNTDVGIMTFSDSVENVEITSCLINGHTMSEGISIYNQVLIKNVVIRDNIVMNKEKAMGICVGYQYNDAVIDARNITIDNNKILNTSTGVAVINPAGVSENVFITNNVIATVSSGGSNGMSIKNVRNGKISNNIITNACLRGISLVGSENINVINNTVMNYDAGVGSAANAAVVLEDSKDCIITGNTIQQNLVDSYNGVLALKGASTKNVFKNNKILPSDTSTKTAQFIGVSGNTSADNVIEFDYSGILPGVSNIDYVTNKFIVNNYTHSLANTMALYNKAYINDMVVSITKTDVILNPALMILHDGAKKQIKIVATCGFTLENSDNLTWAIPNTYEAGTYYFELECRDGHWYETETKLKLEVQGKNENPLYGKAAYFDGDSICYGANSSGYSYPEMIAKNNNMSLTKKAISGTTVAVREGYTNSILERIKAMTDDYDYIIIEGGYNDCARSVDMGTLTSDYVSDLDETTFIGAMESLCKTLCANYFEKKKLFVVPHRTLGTYVNTFYDNAIVVCKKWGIPVIDLREECNLIPLIGEDVQTEYFEGANTGVHPSEQGYKIFYAPKIEGRMKML